MQLKRVGIFRNQLFKFSEPFITQQAQALTHFEPVYIGRKLLGRAPEGARYLSLDRSQGTVARGHQTVNALTRYPGEYVRLLRDEPVDIIHAHFGVDAVYALPLARRLGVPLVTTFHGFDATTNRRGLMTSGSPAWYHYLLFRKQLARDGDVFLCVSDYIRERVLALGFPEERTFVHYTGIDAALIPPRSPVGGAKKIVHVARLVEKKGTRYLILAFKELLRDMPDCELEIIGEGPLEKELKDLVDSLTLNGKVNFLGSLPHETVLMRLTAASVLALPSVQAATGDMEGLGMVLLEAAAMGIPLVGTHHGGIPEVIVHGETGFLVEEKSVTNLKKYLLELVADDDTNVRMGLNAKVMVQDRFEMKCQSKVLERIYESVLKGAC